MNFDKLIKDVKPHAIAILAFFMISFVYYSKTFSGYTHQESDVVQGLLKGTEITKYTDKDGNFPGWTNSIFGGMPSTLVKGKPSGNVVKSYNYLTPVGTTAYPFQIMLLSFIGFYMLMNAFKVKPNWGLLAALVYGFATFSISSVEAAHYTKVLAMALMPAIIASMQWLFGGRYVLGGTTLAFNMALQIYYFHYQITFYTIICMLVLGIYYIVQLVKESKVKQLMIATAISIVAVGAGVISNASKIASTSKFAESTMRGGNDLAMDDPNNKTKTGEKGLERTYAFNWSYGISETFTLLIPGMYGGSTGEKVPEDSEFAQTTGSTSAPLYFGDMNSTSGPIYMGAIICFLFVLGMVVVKNPIKWPLLILTLISFMLGWGGNFGILNDFLFDNLKFFNKFRTPMMAFCIAQVTMPLIGFLGLKQLLETWMLQKEQKKAGIATTDDDIWKKVQYTFYGVGGFCLIVALLGTTLIDLSGAVDSELKKGQNANLIPMLKDLRGSLLMKDAFRSLVYVSIAFGLLWSWYTKKLKGQTAVLLICAAAAVDLVGIDWRYLSWEEFQYKKGSITDVVEDQADKQILADPDLHYRVLDLTKDPFNDNTGAAFHKMIGGYDPAKLSRFQNLISEMISDRQQQDKALDMLNCKYLIGSDDKGNRGVVPRQTALGNAWFVGELIGVAKPIDDLNRLKNDSDLRARAGFVTNFEANKTLTSKKFVVDSSATVRLTYYHPDTMNYVSNNSQDGYLVFSEMYYENWMATIDGKPATINKVDYTLRGLSVPAGQHKIQMYFQKDPNTTDGYERIASYAILLGMLVMIGLWIKSYFNTAKA